MGSFFYIMEFHCKQFSLNHSLSSMKIGTDAILVSALSPKENIDFSPLNILDIGTGCGIISLCMAQKYSKANIIAIDIDKDSVEQAESNFSQSQFSNRLSAKHIDLTDFSTIEEKNYDLIITNPPFFIDSLKSPKEKRSKARHTDSLSFEQLISCSKLLLSEKGILCLILPRVESEIFVQIAKENGFYISGRANFISIEGKAHERVVLYLSTNEDFKIAETSLIIRQKDNSYTQEYKKLVSEFLL